MEPFADFDCVLDVNVHCDACKMRMMEILRSIAGVYSVSIDGEKGKAMVRGEVDPNILMSALSRPGSGKHAELKYAKVNHPRARMMGNNYSDDSSYNYGYNNKYCDNNYYNTIEDPYKYRRPTMLGGHSSHDYYYQTRRPFPEYNDPYYGPNYYPNSYPLPLPPLPAARYVPSYPPMENDQYEDEPISFCSIM
ncbi:hypothetical protein Leryth_011459 [Lithospermum erythrorhizon]|uniref:HMA domain-containing protein n=1 Tax=Lithospermum erythrorhizon TaxID=34254 RepID=A0AAV3Q0Z1_LITER|nr:hypothetical protein Leryth_011459 [Lithospermum erythrorhizon]